jgi:alkylation response protein AidB-like acyl-CoA dehydrogenase
MFRLEGEIMPIDFTLTPEQLQLQGNARQFAEPVLAPVVPQIEAAADARDAFRAGREAFRQMAGAGFTKAFIPVSDGGLGFSMLDFAIAAEELSRVDVNVPTTLLANGLALSPVIYFGTPEQRRRFLRPFVDDGDGSLLAAFAFTDVAGGANFDSEDPSAGIQTLARRDGDEWVITGQKHYTTNGSGWEGKGAHVYSVVCRTDPTKGASESLAVVMVPGDLPGVRVVDAYDKLGHRGVDTPRVDFDEVRVPADFIIGTAGQGVRIVSTAFSWTAALIGSACVGVMRAAFEYALDFAMRERRLGTGPVIEHQNVGFMLADIKMRIEAARYLTWKACHYFDQTGGRGQELAVMTKVQCSELAVQVVYDAMRLVGVQSYTPQTPLERLMRNAMVFPLYDGGNMGVRRRQLHWMFMQPGYHSMLGARGEMPPWEQPVAAAEPAGAASRS